MWLMRHMKCNIVLTVTIATCINDKVGNTSNGICSALSTGILDLMCSHDLEINYSSAVWGST